MKVAICLRTQEFVAEREMLDRKVSGNRHRSELAEEFLVPFLDLHERGVFPFQDFCVYF